MSKKKEMKVLGNALEKFGMFICDTGTYEKRKSNHTIIKFKYEGKPFFQTLPNTPSSERSINNCYSQVRRNLKLIGIVPPPEFCMKIFVSTEESKKEEMIEEIWKVVGTDEND